MCHVPALSVLSKECIMTTLHPPSCREPVEQRFVRFLSDQLGVTEAPLDIRPNLEPVGCICSTTLAAHIDSAGGSPCAERPSTIRVR